jgi:hypothetical protein
VTVTLFDVPDERKPWQRSPHELARLTDPETSHAAAKALGGGAETMRRTLLSVFAGGGSGLTAEEAAGATGIDPWQASKRVSDLLAAKLIEPTGRTRRGTSGRMQRILRITQGGIDAL